MENCSRITYIYGLYEVGKEDEIRYIGKTDNPKSRLTAHISTRDKEKTHKSCWIKSVIKNGGKIKLKIIEAVKYDNWSDREIHWISTYDNLTNTSPGGETGLTGKMFEISYEECKKWVNENYPDIKNKKDFRKIINEVPKFIPKSPHTVFKDYGWVSWQKFLNNNFISSKDKNRKYLSYEECKKWINENYKSIKKWRLITDSFPDFIPKRPYITYKNSGWNGWFDFIGIDLSPKVYEDYSYAKDYAKKLKLSKSMDWYSYYDKNHTNKDFPKVPRCPCKYYKDSGWLSWTDFLGSKVKGNDVYRNKMKYEELLEYVMKNLSHIKTSRDWHRHFRSENINNIPKCPNIVYKNQWVDWNTFLGKNEFKRNKIFYSFQECKDIIKNSNIKSNKEWREWVKNKSGIPKSPETFFKEEWIDWYDWLGKQKKDE